MKKRITNVMRLSFM